MGPYVAVDIAPERANDAESRAMLAACSAALPRGACVRSSEQPPADELVASASVRWTDDGHAHLEVHVEASSAGTLVRDLEFLARNPRIERFRSVGLAIATMVDELQFVASTEAAPAAAPSPPATALAPPEREEPAAASTPSHGAEPAPTARRERPVTRPAEPRRGVFEAGAFVGSAVTASARLGPYARVASDAMPSLYVSAAFASSFKVASAAPSMMWNELLLGGGARVSGGGLRLEAGADVALVATTGSAPSPLNRTSDRRSLWLPAVALESRLSWPAGSALALTLGGRATLLARAVTVTNAGEPVARVPAYNVGATCGARFAF